MTVDCPAAPLVPEVALVPIRLPDQFHSLREVAALSNTAFRLHMSALSWCSVNHTGGLITREDLGLVAAQAHASERHAMECGRRGTWHDARHDCGSGLCLGPQDADGWVVHDFYLYELPEGVTEDAAALERRRAADAARKRKERDRRAVENPQPPRARGRPPREKPQVKNTSRDMSRDRITDPAKSQVKNLSRDVSRACADRSDFDFDQSSGYQVNQSSVRNAREDPALIALVIAEVCAKTGLVIDDAQALRAIGVIRARAARADAVIGDDAEYMRTAIRNEKDLFAELLCPPAPDLEVIFSEPEAPPEPDMKQHPYEEDPVTRHCAYPGCGRPGVDRRHRVARSA